MKTNSMEKGTENLFNYKVPLLLLSAYYIWPVEKRRTQKATYKKGGSWHLDQARQQSKKLWDHRSLQRSTKQRHQLQQHQLEFKSKVIYATGAAKLSELSDPKLMLLKNIPSNVLNIFGVCKSTVFYLHDRITFVLLWQWWDQSRKCCVCMSTIPLNLVKRLEVSKYICFSSTNNRKYWLHHSSFVQVEDHTWFTPFDDDKFQMYQYIPYFWLGHEAPSVKHIGVLHIRQRWNFATFKAINEDVNVLVAL